MRNTGIVRRLDELGRVVIPKEIRSILRLREGEQIEIFMQDETLMLRKFSRLKDGFEEVEKLCQTLKKSARCQVFALDNNSFVFSTEEKLTGREPSEKIVALLESRKKTLANDVALVDGEGYIAEQIYLAPVIACGDLYGAVLIGGDQLDGEQKKLCDFAAGFLAGCIENA